jgi:hypothetical protein
MTDPNENRIKLALGFIAQAILDTVQECPQGAPAGHLYAGCMAMLDLDHFEQIMSALVRNNKIRKDGHQYFPVTADLRNMVPANDNDKVGG